MLHVIMKGENHASQDDHEEELELIREEMDALALKGAE